MDAFEDVKQDTGLFKLAAHAQLDSSKDKKHRKEISIKYQVFSKETAMVGVVKQENKTTNELKEYTIDFGKNVVKERDDSDDDHDMMFGMHDVPAKSI